MNIEYVRAKIEEIQKTALADDDPRAHILEDTLYEEFARHVAALCDDPHWADNYYHLDGKIIELCEMAKELIKTQDIDFGRWYE
jgi:hypothetical protein